MWKISIKQCIQVRSLSVVVRNRKNIHSSRHRSLILKKPGLLDRASIVSENYGGHLGETILQWDSVCKSIDGSDSCMDFLSLVCTFWIHNLYTADPKLWRVVWSGACFSKVPKLCGRISGDIILFVSSKRRRLKARNFAVIFTFIPCTTYQKTRFTE